MQRDQNFIRVYVNQDHWQEEYCANDLSSVEEDATCLKLLRSKALTDKCFQSAIKSLCHCKDQHVDQHVAHTDTG